MSSYVLSIPPKSAHEIDTEANAFLRHTAPECLASPKRVPVYRIFDSLDQLYPQLDSGVADLPPEVDGECHPDGRVLLSEPTYSGLTREDGRSRFTALHEIYHALKHMPYVRRMKVERKIVLYRKQALPAYLDPEWQANTFAAAALMPVGSVAMLAKVHENWELPAQMVKIFAVSISAATYRASGLRKRGLIP